MAGTCQARVGPYAGPVTESLTGAEGCTEPATVTIAATCACGHPRSGRYCPRHGELAPPDAVWRCAACAQAGHDCPMTPEVVPDG